MFRIINIVLLFLSVSLFAVPKLDEIKKNRDTLGKFQKFELSVKLTAVYNNPFDEDQITLFATFISPAGKFYKVNGFYFRNFIRSGPPEVLTPDGIPFWKIRFTPKEIGVWRVMITCRDVTGTISSPYDTFIVVSSQEKGFISVANKNFMKFDDGTQFFPVGENIPFYDTIKQTYRYQEFMDKLSANKANFIRVWMSSASFAIEWTGTPLGNYSNRMDRAYQLDWLLDYAREKNIYVQLCLYNHGQFSTLINPEWDFNPYNVAQGGHLEFPFQFFYDSLAVKYNKIKIKYILARWGYSTNIFAWELFNEIDNIDSFYVIKNKVNGWLLETARFIKENDTYNHLVTNSYYNENLDELIWVSPHIDFTQTHYYSSSSDVQSLHYVYSQTKVNDYFKPSFIGEFDFLELGEFAKINDPNGIDMHNSLWANAFSGACGSPATWSWDNFIDFRNLYYHFKGISSFIDRTNLLSSNFYPIIPVCSSSSKSAYNVTAGFTTFGRAPQNLFDVSAEGFVSPSNIYLGRYLFGMNSVPGFRNPPEFIVNNDSQWEFKVSCGKDSGASPRIKIVVNGATKLDQPASVNTSYSVIIPSGLSRIVVDNPGYDWITIDEFIFSNFVKNIRSYVLRGDSVIIGWVHNRNYNWKYLHDIGTPDTIFNSSVTIYGLKKSGFYKLEWYDCKENNLISSTFVNSEGTNITLNVPPILWDYAFKLSYYGMSSISNEGNSEKNYTLTRNYPNPFNNVTRISFTVPADEYVKINLFNSLGEKVAVLVNDFLKAGDYKYDLSLSGFPSGIYFCRMEAGKFSSVIKMSLIK